MFTRLCCHLCRLSPLFLRSIKLRKINDIEVNKNNNLKPAKSDDTEPV